MIFPEEVIYLAFDPVLVASVKFTIMIKQDYPNHSQRGIHSVQLIIQCMHTIHNYINLQNQCIIYNYITISDYIKSLSQYTTITLLKYILQYTITTITYSTYVYRFMHNSRNPTNQKVGPLSADEINKALVLGIYSCQHTTFH